SQGVCTCRATTAGFMNTPEPTMPPITTRVASMGPSRRARPGPAVPGAGAEELAAGNAGDSTAVAKVGRESGSSTVAMHTVVLLCTVRGCREPLRRDDRRYVCARGHSFDLAKSGYLNLLQAQDRRSASPGDR